MSMPCFSSCRLGLALSVVVFGLLAHVSPVHAAPESPPSKAEGALDRGDPRVTAELLVDVGQAATSGTPFRVGVRFRMDPRWHIYWRSPGDAGLVSDVKFQADGVEFSPLRYPFPETFRTSDGFITTYGYADEVLLFADARPSSNANAPLRITAEVSVLACDVNCIPAELKLSREVPIGPNVTPAEGAVRKLFDSTAARIPQPLSPDVAAPVKALVHGTAPGPGQTFQGELRPVADAGWRPGRKKDFFVPEVEAGGSLSSLKLETTSDGRTRMEGQLAGTWDATPRLKGVAHLKASDGNETFYELDLPLELSGEAPAPLPVGPLPSDPSLAWILLLAFAGGALLNLMPCVFPVLALKAYGFARLVHEDRRAVAAHAGAYTAGVVGSMALLAVAVTLAKLGGASVGWGFQFQEPLFLAAVSAVVVAFALNLFGVYYVGFGATGVAARVDASHGLGRSVGEGALAVLLATPCSAPLLGTAVGFAFAAGTATTFAVFMMLGLGLAAPFCVLVLVPGLAKRLPRPGEWMERLKQLLGFALMATAAWLLWVMGGLAGVEGMGRLAAFLVAVSLATWLFGLSQVSTKTNRRWAGRGLALAVLLGAGVVTLDFPDAPAGAPPIQFAEETRPWSEEAVEAALDEGRPVFVDFTADWCLTCKFNERTVLASDEVRETFIRNKVAFFVADWTRRDETIRLKLAEHGRAGVPMYLVIGPQRREQPEVLPELLTTQMIVEAIGRAAPATPTTQARKEPSTP